MSSIKQYLLEKYNLSSLERAIRQPNLVIDELRRLPIILQNLWFKYTHPEPIDVMDKDWDNLLILDACRFDYFEDHNEISGELTSVVSHGSHSWEFIEGNFIDRKLHDTVYVSANPHTEKLPSNLFHAVEPIYQTEWNSELGTVLPEDMVTAALQANEQYPNKRLVIHFMQPHEPLLGQTADSLRERFNLRGFTKFDANPDESSETSELKWHQAARRGLIPRSDLQNAYAETLDIVLKHVEILLDKLDGMSVVTADHGELLGERLFPHSSRWYGHPHDVYTAPLCVVPWLEISNGSRRHITTDPPVKFDRLEDEIVSTRLEALGYVEG